MAREGSAKSGPWLAPGTRRTIAAAIPVSMVNAVAFIGQFAYIQAHFHVLPAGAGHATVLATQVLIAMTFESIAVYLAWNAHIATMSNDSAFATKLGAYLFALVMGAMNYSHYAAPHWHPTVVAVGMALMSAASPWLWGVHTKRASRDALAERGLIEKHALRLGMTRWLWHAARSFRVMYWATWHAETDPKRAIAHFEYRYGTTDTPEPPTRRAVKRASEPVALRVAQSPARAALSEIAVPVAVVSEPEAAPARQASVPVPELDVPALQADGWRVTEGTEILGPQPAVHSATVSLQANPKAWNERKRPPQDVIDNAQLTLAGMSMDQVNSTAVRWVARELLLDGNQKRLAKQLLDERKAVGTSLVDAPGGEQAFGYANPVQRVRPGMIASPAAFQPGGSGGGAVNG